MCKYFFLIFLFPLFTASAGIASRLNLIPQPTEVTRLEGCWRGSRQVVRETDSTLPPEGYVLEVTTNGIKIVSSGPAGAFYAEKTLAQLGEDDGSLPCVRIRDVPAYRWRGYLLDCSRHFMDVATVKQVLDWMADYKFNVFHWHLVDDQGWRFPTKKYPRLRTVGATRPVPDWIGPGIYDDPGRDTYGPFGYSEEDIREIRAYASARHIRIVPEMEIPGHSREVVVAYPEFYCENADAKAYTNMNNIGLCLGKDETIRFFKDCLDEFCELFPDSEVIHIGGDECPRENWKKCPKCQARMRELGLGNEDELQSWCTRQMTDYLAKKGRKAIGWNEIVAGGLASNVVVMCWNENAHEAANLAMRQGNPVVMTPVEKCYFNMSEKGARNYVPRTGKDLRWAYYFDPCEKLEVMDRSLVWGGQCCTWTERVIDRKDLEWAAFPLFFATAEALWPGPDRKPGLEDFKVRAAVHRERLLHAGVNAARIAFSFKTPIPI